MTRRLHRDEDGTITIWVLGLCVVVLMLGGIGLDLWRATSARRALGQAAEAAAIAGAAQLDQAAYRSGNRVRLDPARARAAAAAHLDASSSSFDGLEVSPSINAAPTGVRVELRSSIDLGLTRVLVGGEPIELRVVARSAPMLGS